MDRVGVVPIKLTLGKPVKPEPIVYSHTLGLYVLGVVTSALVEGHSQ